MNITGANQFTPEVYRRANEGCDVAVSGTFTAKVTIQASKDAVTWIDVSDTLVPNVFPASGHTAWYVRAGVKTGNYTSGTVVVDIF